MLNGWVSRRCSCSRAPGYSSSAASNIYCLDRCRTPFGFIHAALARHSTPAPRLRLGLDHGLYCVGCWGNHAADVHRRYRNVGWMLALGAVMAVEKNAPWGARLSRPLGAALIAGAGLLAGVNLLA